MFVGELDFSDIPIDPSKTLRCLLRLLPHLCADNGCDPDEPAQRSRRGRRWGDCQGRQGGQHQVKVSEHRIVPKRFSSYNCPKITLFDIFKNHK